MEVKTGQDLPFEILDLDPEVAAERKNHFNDEDRRYVLVGPKGYFLREKYRQDAFKIYTMPLRSTDVFVTGYPRSGTTWTQELVWLVLNDLDFEKSKSTPLSQRYTFLEYSMLMTTTSEAKLKEENAGSETKSKLLNEVVKSGVEKLAAASSPRFIKSHLPLSLLPPTLLDTAKVLYLARDPRDVVVSYYHFQKNMTDTIYFGDFKTFWNYFRNDLQIWSPYFEQVKEAWQKRHHPNMLFLFYEELVKDMANVAQRVAKFFNKQMTEDQISRLCEHLHIDNFRKNKSVNLTAIRDIGVIAPTKDAFIRKGKVGGWRDLFDEEMTKEAEQWIEENLRDTDLIYPTE